MAAKGQLISKYPFGVFKSPKKNTKFLEARAEILKNIPLFFWEIFKAPKGHFEINWPLIAAETAANAGFLAATLKKFSIYCPLLKKIGFSIELDSNSILIQGNEYIWFYRSFRNSSI